MRRLAFTMAEILLSLTIIGVVAAITLPSLTGNINERTWNTQRKALYARMSQAIALMPALNGFGTYSVSGSGSDASITDNVTETFIASGLSKVLKINNICDNTHFEDCGIVSSYTGMAGTQKTVPTTLYKLNGHFSSASYSGTTFSTNNSKAVAFETQNGESIIAYYNPSCITEFLNEEGAEVNSFPEKNMCLNFVYDLNGSKGPNTVGKDIGIMTVFNATDSVVVAPMPSSARNASGTHTFDNAPKACTSEDPDSRIPNIDELSSMLINKDLINLSAPDDFRSGSVYNKGKVWTVRVTVGHRYAYNKTTPLFVRCIKR